MSNHFIHYLRRDVRMVKSQYKSRRFYQQIQQTDEGFDKPSYHITKSKKGPSSRIKTNDIIWIFSILYSKWGSTPPSLDAKIIVKKIQKLENGNTKFHASMCSKWYPLFDARKCLMKLRTITKYGKTNKLIKNTKQPIGLSMRGIREIKNIEVIINWSDHVNSVPYDFVSYSLSDGTCAAFRKVSNLINNGTAVFWDRYSLPRRLTERGETISCLKLDEYLEMKLTNSNKVWGIETKKYAQEKSYSLLEFNLANKLNKYNPVIVCAG